MNQGLTYAIMLSCSSSSGLTWVGIQVMSNAEAVDVARASIANGQLQEAVRAHAWILRHCNACVRVHKAVFLSFAVQSLFIR